MIGWISSAWGQTWPNLVANVIWVPVVGIHHWLLKRHMSRLHEKENNK